MDKDKNRHQRYNWIIIGINAVCVVLIVVLFLVYAKSSRDRFYSQNVTDIENLNRSAANVAEALFSNQDQRLGDIAKYVHNQGMTLEQTLDYIYLSDAGRRGNFELLDTDGRGYGIVKGDDGRYIPLTYTQNSYRDLHDLMAAATAAGEGVVSYTPEFTDAYTAFKSFAFYTTLVIAGPDGEECCTLMDVVPSKDFIELIHPDSSYADLATMLIDGSGNYIIGDADFKSNNLFSYLYMYNGLTMEERIAIADQVLQAADGSITYDDSIGRSCIYVFYRQPESNWYSVTCVPLSNFRITDHGSLLAVLETIVLAGMLIMDIVWLERVNRKLTVSVTSERSANAAKTDFLSRISHDIRTPLNAILGFTAIARETPGLPPAVDDDLSKIDSSGRYLLSILNDVLDMSKIESGRIELHIQEVELKPFLVEVADTFAAQAELKGIELRTDFTVPKDTWVATDPLRTKQIYANLLSNAIKFSKAGSSIDWSVTAVGQDDGRVSVASRITDHGCGMSPAFMTHLYEPFSQEAGRQAADVQGTGLGLAIVKRLVDLLGGTIQAESTLGSGTTFTITGSMPAGHAAPPAAAPVDTDADDRTLAGKRVLVVEDNVLNQQIAVMLLGSRHMITEQATNGQAAIDMFAASPVGYYDLVLMDIRMPVLDGLKATARIRALERADAKTVPIVAMTANAYDDDVDESLKAGMDAHLAKPIEPAAMFKVLSRLLGRTKR